MLTNKVKHPNPSLCSIEGVLTEGEFQKRKHEILFNVSTDALSILDLATGQFIECNNAAVKMMGLSSKSEFLYSTPAVLYVDTYACRWRIVSLLSIVNRFAC